jgi:uncharacterized protein (DUF2062 family)
MVFRRRTPLTLPQKLRAFVLPPGGWRRSLTYLRLRLTRISDQPHRVARGIACGMFVGCTPFFGLHLPLAAALAWAFRGNVVAALLGTAVSNPVTIPLMAVLSLDLGRVILGDGLTLPFREIMTAFGQAGDEITRNIEAIFTPAVMHWDKLAQFWHEVFLPYLVGSLGPALGAALLGYWISLPMVEAYHNMRARRREARAQDRPESTRDSFTKEN